MKPAYKHFKFILIKPRLHYLETPVEVLDDNDDNVKKKEVRLRMSKNLIRTLLLLEKQIPFSLIDLTMSLTEKNSTTNICYDEVQFEDNDESCLIKASKLFMFRPGFDWHRSRRVTHSIPCHWE